MKIKYILAAGLMALTLSSQAQQISQLGQAMLDGYSELLRENPRDYQTLYERAAQYFGMSDYQKSLADLQKAIEYTPEKETVLRGQEYSLLADVDIELKDYEGALRAVDNALALNPNSYSDIYKKGNICLYLNRNEDAYKAFSSMQRLKSRSQEAYFGMAQACLRMGKQSEADALIKEAENADPNNYITYCRIGDLYREMRQDENAAANYLSAISLGNGSTRPLQSLISLASNNYGAVESALDFALSKTENKLPLNFLKGNIAYNSGNYDKAVASLKEVVATEEGKAEGVYQTLLSAMLGAGDYMGAGQLSQEMQAKFPGLQTSLLASETERAFGSNTAALVSARKALQMAPDDESALRQVAITAIACGDGNEALRALNQLVMSNPENIEPLLLRYYVQTSLMKNEKAGAADLSRAAGSPADGVANISYKAMAKTLSGKKLDGDALIEKMLSDFKGKDAYYAAAVYYAQTGDVAKGKDMLQKAVDAGYQNKFNLDKESTPMISVAPLR